MVTKIGKLVLAQTISGKGASNNNSTYMNQLGSIPSFNTGSTTSPPSNYSKSDMLNLKLGPAKSTGSQIADAAIGTVNNVAKGLNNAAKNTATNVINGVTNPSSVVTAGKNLAKNFNGSVGDTLSDAVSGITGSNTLGNTARNAYHATVPGASLADDAGKFVKNPNISNGVGVAWEAAKGIGTSAISAPRMALGTVPGLAREGQNLPDVKLPNHTVSQTPLFKF